jgi:hypothetical protein
MSAEKHDYRYAVHGLTIASELELPELELLTGDLSVPADVKVRVGRLLSAAGAPANGLDFVTTERGELLALPDRGGQIVVGPECQVTVEIADHADAALARLFLFGSVFGLICHRRGLLPLHASAVAIGSKAIAFCGAPGMGKSTLAAFCVDAGARLVADDILVVGVDSRNRAMANPGMPKLKLWRDALELLEQNTEGMTRDWARAEKFHVAAGEHMVAEPVQLTQVFVLEVDENAGAGRITPLSGGAAVAELIQHTYRPEYLDRAHRRAPHFAECARLAGLMKVASLKRRRDTGSLRKTARMLLDSYLSPS